MTTLTNLLIIFLLFVMIIQLSMEIYEYFINRRENIAFIKLQETFNNVQQDFANEKANFRKIIDSKNNEIQILASEVNRLKNELIKFENNQ